MDNLKKIGKYIIIAIGIYFFVFLLINFLIPFFYILLAIIGSIIIYIIFIYFYNPQKNFKIYFKNKDFKNDPEYEYRYEDDELGELISVFSIEYVNPKKVDISKVILPYNRIKIVVDYYTDEAIRYVSESKDGFNSEKLNSEIEKALAVFEKKNNFDVRFYIFDDIEVYKDKKGEINIGINNTET